VRDQTANEMKHFKI